MSDGERYYPSHAGIMASSQIDELRSQLAKACSERDEAIRAFNEIGRSATRITLEERERCRQLVLNGRVPDAIFKGLCTQQCNKILDLIAEEIAAGSGNGNP